MCGISGFCSFETDFEKQPRLWQQVLCDMRTALAHRGPDQNGEYLAAHVGLSHARLSIRDLENGRQPMGAQTNERDCVIVYNGEIYNADELRRDLMQAGYLFETTSDTEVILSAYLHEGEDFVQKLNGIFAFAIWDEGKETLLLYRDRVGVKPLFYAEEGGSVVFASEPKSLFCHPEIWAQIDEDGLREVLAIGPARTPGCGVFRGVREVLPGHFRRISRDGVRDVTYWDLTVCEHTDTYEETVEHVGWLVEDAIRRQMVSDVPVCSFLSGGIDSSIVTAYAARFLREQGRELSTFSFDFVGNDENFKASAFQPERDHPYVLQMLDAYQLCHTFLECDDETLFAYLMHALDAKDLPGMTDVDASLLYFCSRVREHNRVALTGECADEIFGGYPWFYREELMRRDGFPWASDLDARCALLSDETIRRLSLREYADERYRESVARAPHRDGETPEAYRRREIAYLNIKWFMQTLLDRMDRASMASGLEARVPFADHRIIEYVYNVPWHMKYQNGVEKALLRDACRDLLPAQLLGRKKSPYPKTYSPKYTEMLAHTLTALVEDRSSPISALVDRERTLAFAAAPAEYGRPWYGQLMAGPQLMAYYIQLNEWLSRYRLCF